MEKLEKRHDAQIARQVICALPKELTDEQRRGLVESFVQKSFLKSGIVAFSAIHAPSSHGDQRNFHAHILLTMREIGQNGFGKKVRSWNSKTQLMVWRREWEQTVNHYLQRCGHNEKIDHRSLRDQGVDREPTIHLGVFANLMERRGVMTRRGNMLRDIQVRNQLRAVVQRMSLMAWDNIAPHRYAMTAFSKIFRSDGIKCVTLENYKGQMSYWPIEHKPLGIFSDRLPRLSSFPFTAQIRPSCCTKILTDRQGDSNLWHQQQLSKLERNIAIDKIKRDIFLGHNPSIQALHRLTPYDLELIKRGGFEYFFRQQELFQAKGRNR